MSHSTSRRCLGTSAVLLCILAFGNGVQSSGKGFFQIKLRVISDIVWPLFMSKCSAEDCPSLPRIQIRICIKMNQTKEYLREEPCYPDNKLQVTFEAPSANLLQSRFELDKNMPGNLVVIIEAKHVGNTTFGSNGKLVARGVLSHYFRSASSWSRVSFENDKKQTFYFSYVNKCKRNFYGYNCDKYCEQTVIGPFRPHGPFYFCSDKGDWLCLAGWGGENCDDYCMECCIRGTCSPVKPCNCDRVFRDAPENLIQ